MRWLLNTRRVPVLPRAASDTEVPLGAAEHVKPTCAGIGDPDKAAWLCHECAGHLCRTRPKMPPQALANWNWAGRQHPQYQNLSMATRNLLGLGRLVMRIVLLKPNDDTDESEKAIVGNTILVAQPSPQLIAAQLPPTETEQASYFNVIYGAGTAEQGPQKLAKKKALIVDREEYLECARIRSERCPLFAEVPISAGTAQEHLPEVGVPYGTERGAVEMDTLEYFAPNLSGPATRDTPFSGDQDKDLSLIHI